MPPNRRRDAFEAADEGDSVGPEATLRTRSLEFTFKPNRFCPRRKNLDQGLPWNRAGAQAQLDERRATRCAGRERCPPSVAAPAVTGTTATAAAAAGPLTGSTLAASAGPATGSILAAAARTVT
jgi:hypothetical protein